MNTLKNCTIVTIAFSIFLFLTYVVVPPLRLYLLIEDGIIENIGTVLFFALFLASLFWFFQGRSRHSGLLWLSLVGLICFLDEISFGARYFNLTMPMVLGIRLDAVHDLIDISVHAVTLALQSSYRAIAALLLFGLAGLVVFAVGRYFVGVMKQQTLRQYLTEKFRSQPFSLMMMSVGFLVAASIIDLDFIDHNALFLLEEIFETDAAISLLFFGYSLYKKLESVAVI